MPSVAALVKTVIVKLEGRWKPTVTSRHEEEKRTVQNLMNASYTGKLMFSTLSVLFHLRTFTSIFDS